MINSINNFSNIFAFKGYNPNRKFDLTRIDGIPCAYCGEKMFALNKFDKLLGEIKSATGYLQLGRLYKEYLNSGELQCLNGQYLISHPRGAKFAIRNLLLPHSSTIEHIVPQSKGGLDDITNYMAVCYGCNSNRGSIDLYEMIKFNPNIADKIKIHIDFLQKNLPELIKNRKLQPEYNNYPEILKNTLKNVSKGLLDRII